MSTDHEILVPALYTSAGGLTSQCIHNWLVDIFISLIDNFTPNLATLAVLHLCPLLFGILPILQALHPEPNHCGADEEAENLNADHKDLEHIRRRSHRSSCQCAGLGAHGRPKTRKGEAEFEEDDDF